ncbi:LLM class flavin-dependent oxidoreductase [Bailinhaonella thermotolerans]|uniref:LLM class flavin-dependent oxidoreductase n=1 Tax=Bailinhaonella thermotolerans TaxID=1070861 RepID=A0A3A4AY67_9ACTN|nr:LLM class flavin-dependent oxidoreductase [Bailinhaonella thermotolerans]RJL34053.1 LLM class flavin-dependent oxidoreductase [Bailinhaonella thermotolerans]
MNETLRATRFSILDRALIPRGGDAAGTLRDTVRFAREAEALGYHRFWVAEHHSVPGIAGSAPTVLAAAVAGATSRIRVGTGGVMLPNHRPLVVAEQFGVLESLHPGRIDMGLGRSVGFTGGVRRALGHDRRDAEEFGERIRELLGYFSGEQAVHPGVHAVPGEGLRVPAFVLATGSGADIAAEHGLALVIALFGGEERTRAAIARYRENFRPSALWPRPYVAVAANVAVAETAEEAERLHLSEAYSTAYSRTHGDFPPLLPPGDVLALDLSERERALLEESMAGRIAGTERDVEKILTGLVERTAADEVLVNLSTHSRADQLDSYRRLARVAGLASS